MLLVAVSYSGLLTNSRSDVNLLYALPNLNVAYNNKYHCKCVPLVSLDNVDELHSHHYMLQPIHRMENEDAVHA